MSRIASRFESLKKQKRKALIPYITAGDPSPALTVPLLHALVEGGADILELQKLIRRVPVADHVVRYAVRLARATRGREGAPPFVKQWVSWGAGPRASQYLVLGAKTRAVLLGRYAPGIEDVKAVAPAVLRHRIISNFTAEAEGIRPERIIEDLLHTVPSE